jgi:hypothetical protein
MDNQDYILDHDTYRAFMALRDFADNAFCGYAENRGREEELKLADTFTWLVRDFFDLVDASKEMEEEYIENRPYLYRLMKQQEVLRMQREIKEDI